MTFSLLLLSFHYLDSEVNGYGLEDQASIP